MPELIIQPSINDVRSQSLLGLIERTGTLDLSPILVYRLDSAPDSALLALAWQFDMLAPEWQLGAPTGEAIDALSDIDSLTDIDTLSSVAESDGVSDFSSWRIVLKASIPLHRSRGTPYAVKTALGSLGWSNVTLQEGQSSWGGTLYPASQGWAVFRVLVDIAAGQTVGVADATRIVAAVNFFKPVRAWLDSLWLNLPALEEQAAPPTDVVVSIFSQSDAAPTANDLVAAAGWPVVDTRSIRPTYDAHFYHTGITYGANEPAIADTGVTVQGAAIAASE